MSNFDRVRERDDAEEQARIIDLQQASEHTDYLIAHMPLHKLESALVDCIQSRLNNRNVISKLFDDNVDFQEWIAGVRDELCERIAKSDIEASKND